jgi:hypothetical protein
VYFLFSALQLAYCYPPESSGVRLINGPKKNENQMKAGYCKRLTRKMLARMIQLCGMTDSRSTRQQLNDFLKFFLACKG